MADKKVTVTIEAVDKASDTIKSISTQLSSLGQVAGLSSLSKLSSTLSSIGNVFSGLKSKASLAVAGIGLAVNGFNKLYTASKQSFIDGLSKIGSVCKTVIDSVLSVGKSFLSLVGDVANSDLSLQGLIKTGLNYDQTLERIGIKAEASGSQLAQLDDVMKNLTVNTVYSMDEIATAAEYMIQNGRTTTQVMEELEGVVGLATIGNLDLADSADIVASTMNMFSKQGLTATQIANVLATAGNKSGASVENLAKSLENCGPQAAALNIPFQEVVAALALMGDNAIKGGKAGTALKNLFQRMAAPTSDAAKAIEEFGLESARTKIVSGDLKGGLLEMKEALDLSKVSADDQQRAVKQLAGAYGTAGLTSILNTATDELMVMFEAMEKGLVTTDDLEAGMKRLMNTTQGQLMRFSANVQLAAYNLKNSFEDAFVSAMNVINNFMSKLNSGEGITSALKYLETECAKLPQILENAISNAISGINSFINGGALDSILNIGTDIIQGICNGINKAYNSGTLVSAISGFIEKICNFIQTNGPAIQKAGEQIIDAIKQGIELNADNITGAMKTLCGIIETWVQGSAELQSAMGQFADTMMESFVKQVGIKAKAYGEELLTAIADVFNWEGLGNLIDKGLEALGFEPKGEQSGTEYTTGANKGINGTPLELNEGNFTELYNQYGNYGLTGGQNFGTSTTKGLESTKSEIVAKGSEVGTGTAQAIQDGLESMDTTQLTELKNAIDQVGQQTTTTALTMSTAFTNIANSARTSFMNFTNIVRNQMVNVANIINNQMANACTQVRTQAVNMANIFRNQFVNMANIVRNQFVNVANIVRNQMVNACNIVRNQCVNMANIFRNQFVSMANVARNQMVNVSNIIRNQAVSWSNIISNQVTNARNAFTSQMLSMAAVARTQMVNISNIVRNQAVTWSNIIRNQAQNARNALTSSFMSMAAVARTQMAKVLSVVQSYMSQIAAACNKTLTLKVNISKTETTTKKVVVEESSLGLSIPQTSSLSASQGGTRASATTTGLGTLVGALSATNGGSRAISIEVPLVLEGREIARASAVYTREELAKLEKRSSRKRGE